MRIYRHTDGQFIAGDKYEIDRLMDDNSWATCDCENVTGHPVLSKQLRKFKALDYSGYLNFTATAFTAQGLVKALLGAQYTAIVGYNPFLDSPEITVEEVERTLAEYLEEVRKAKK